MKELNLCFRTQTNDSNILHQCLSYEKQGQLIGQGYNEPLIGTSHLFLKFKIYKYLNFIVLQKAKIYKLLNVSFQSENRLKLHEFRHQSLQKFGDFLSFHPYNIKSNVFQNFFLFLKFLFLSSGIWQHNSIICFTNIAVLRTTKTKNHRSIK